MPKPTKPTAAALADAEPGAPHSRPPSIWPDTTQQHADGTLAAAFALSHFDPQAEERSRQREQASVSFDVCHPALAFRAVVGVQAVLAIVALAGADTLVAWGERQAVLSFGGVAATLVWLVVVCALRRWLQGLAPGWRASVVLAVGAAAALGGWWPLTYVGLVTEPGPLRAAAVALGGMAIAAATWAWLDLRSRLWQPALSHARLAELQSRIRPHFLFNALNTAIALVRVDPGRAEAVLEDLAELFRVALADAGASVSLADEIELARRYLAIEQVRFGERLTVQWSVDARTLAARVPPLMLQPLVENAVRHGIEPRAQGGWVRVQAVRTHGQVEVRVTNTVGEDTGAPGAGMALHNLRERLRLLHDVAAQCDVWRDHEDATPGRAATDVFCARVVLPAP